MSLFPVDAADEPKTWTNLAQSSTSCWILIEGVRRVPHKISQGLQLVSCDQVMQEYGFNSALCEAGSCRSKDLKDDIWKMSRLDQWLGPLGGVEQHPSSSSLPVIRPSIPRLDFLERSPDS